MFIEMHASEIKKLSSGENRPILCGFEKDRLFMIYDFALHKWCKSMTN